MKQKPLNVWIHGISGRMGIEIQSAMCEHTKKFILVGGSGRKFLEASQNGGKAVTAEKLAQALVSNAVDLIFDFSNADGNTVLETAIAKAKVKHMSVVIGSTAISDDQLKKWQKHATNQKIKVLAAPNTSLGILVLQSVAREAALVLKGKGFDVEIVEAHHRNKADSPSGTSLLLAKHLAQELPKAELVTARKSKRQKQEIGIHSIRGGNVFGEHKILFLGDAEELVFSHRALSRTLFAKGALTLSLWLHEQKDGFYQLSDVDLKQLPEF